MRVAELFVYPIKSCRGIALERAEVTASGLRWDRHWMLVRPTGRFVTQRDFPRLALIATELNAEHLTVRAPNHASLQLPLQSNGEPRSVVVWRDPVRGLDCGDDAAAWFTSVVGEPLRLVAFDASTPRYSSRDFTGEVVASTEFSDGYAVLVIAEASLADLNARLPSAPLPMNRFRPNIVLRDAPAYAEDELRDFAIGSVSMRGVKACVRCVVTTTNQDTAEVGGEEPLRTLKSYRFDRALLGVTFGQNAIVLGGAGSQIAIGMPVRLAAREAARTL